MSDQNIAFDRYYTVLKPGRIQASLRSRGAQATDSCAVQLKEISTTGAVLLLAAIPQIQGECELALESRKLDEPLLAVGKIDWARPNPAGEWQIGCAFEPPISQEIFKKLFNSGLLERRASPRDPARVMVQVQLEPQAPRLPAIVRNISEGGLCCLTTSSPPTNTRQVCIFADSGETEARIQLKVRWSMRAGDEYFVGCQFVRQSDFAVLRKIQLHQLNVEREAKAGQTPACAAR
jgi:hypothetical protein